MLHYASNLDSEIRLAFTTQGEGNLALHVNDDPQRVRANRARLEDRIGVRRFSLRFMNQVHSAEVLPADRGERNSWDDPAPTCDGLFSATANEPLAVMVADCLPVLFVARNPSTGHTATAAVHAGRRGLLDGILTVAVAKLRGAGSTEVEAVIGPAICGKCYEVPESMARESEAVMPGIRSTTAWGTAALDLPSAAAAQLAELGVQVRATGHCTLEDERYFSYRRANTAGRLAGLVWRAA